MDDNVAEMAEHLDSASKARSIEELNDQIEGCTYAARFGNQLQLEQDHPNFRLVDGGTEGPCIDGAAVTKEKRANIHVRDFARLHGIDLGAPPGAFYRWPMKPEEIDIARRSELRPSRNQVTKEPEFGLCVVEGPWLYWFDRTSCYFVAGSEVGRGSDGEPCLDVGTLAVVSDLMSRREVLEKFYERNRQRLLSLEHETGVPQVRLFSLLIGIE